MKAKHQRLTLAVIAVVAVIGAGFKFTFCEAIFQQCAVEKLACKIPCKWPSAEIRAF